MSFDYKYVINPTGQVDNNVLREMFDDLKDYINTLSPSGSAAPADAQYITLATNTDLTAERVLTGTANQVIITDNGAGSTAVLSLPQSIATSSNVDFNRLILPVGTITSPSLYFDPVGSQNQEMGMWIKPVGSTTGAIVFSQRDVDDNTTVTFAEISAGEFAVKTLLSSTGNIIASGSVSGTDGIFNTSLQLEETGAGTDKITIQAPSAISAGYTLTLPVDDGTSNQVLTTDGSGVLSWSTPSVGTALYREDYIVGTSSGNYTGSTTVFDLSHTYTTGDNSMAVYVDGVLQTIGSGVDYVETDSDTVTFNNALLSGQKVSFYFSIPTAASDYATKALDNLGSVAINTSLISDTDVTDDLGSSSKKWKDVWAQKVKGLSAASANGEAVRFEQLYYGFQSPILATTTTSTIVNNNTFTTTGFSASITPTSASHRIKISFSGGLEIGSGAANIEAYLTIKRGSTDLASGSGGFAMARTQAATAVRTPASFVFIDSPATTSSTTYTVFIKNSDNATNVRGPITNAGETGVLILEEIV